jgi:hypothetical protein
MAQVKTIGARTVRQPGSPRGDHARQQACNLTNQNFASSLRSLSALVGSFTLPERISSGVTFRP